MNKNKFLELHARTEKKQTKLQLISGYSRGSVGSWRRRQS